MNNYKIKIPKNISLKEIRKFFRSIGASDILSSKDNINRDSIKMRITKPYAPDLVDLYRLYQFIILNKRTTILEFGSGWSSLVISFALKILSKKYKKQLIRKKIRRKNPFELFILENEKKYLNITKKRIKKVFVNNNIKINYHFSNVFMSKIENHFVTEYETLPLCNPDFIYLDGPDQFNVKNTISGFTIKHDDMMPIVGDLLKIEFFLIPGTIILADGRNSNVRFLIKNFKRKWTYRYFKGYDQSLLYLNESSLGKVNSELINFYKNK